MEEPIGYSSGHSAKAQSSTFDELPVGGGKGPHQYNEIEESTSRKSAKVVQEEHQPPPVHGLKAKNSEVFEDDDRPIKPKATPSYMDKDPMLENDMGGMDSNTGGSGMPVEKFPPGQHPLEGIAGFLELPTPEPLTAKNR